MRTKINLWIEPMVMNHERCSERFYFNCIVEGDHTKLSVPELEKLLEGRLMYSIMDFANIDCNWNYSVVSATSTNKKPIIEYAISPEKAKQDKEDKELVISQKKKDLKIAKIINSKKPLELTKENVEIQDGGMISVSLPSLKVNEKIDFSKIWDIIEKDFIGKIKEGDNVVLSDDNGNKIFEITGGSFLNVGLADLSIYDAKKKNPNPSIFNHSEGLKGGLFVRKDGAMDIGDFKRTLYLRIYTNNLLKASLKLKKPLMEIINNKLLKK